jgi:hypothetical protein
LTGEGKVYVTTPTPPPPPPANYAYTAETVIVFGDVYPVTGGPINVSTAIVVGNIGNRTITGFLLSNIVYPAGIVTPSLTVADVTILPGGDADVVFTLTGTAPASAQTIDLAGVTCTLTPTGP